MKIYGHRGCRGILPENSIEGFKKALELGADGIEWDVVVNKNNELIISHEPYIDSSYCLFKGDKIKNKNKSALNIYKMDTDQIAQYDCGSLYQSKFPSQQLIKTTKPTVKKALELLKNKNPTILFEIKSSEEDYEKFQPRPKEYCQIIKKELEEYPNLENIIFMSFDANIINELEKIMPNQRYVYLVYKPKINIKAYLRKINFSPYALGMYHKLIKKTTIDKLHNKKIKVFAWTVNDKKKGLALRNKQLDGLITDYPNIFVDQLK